MSGHKYDITNNIRTVQLHENLLPEGEATGGSVKPVWLIFGATVALSVAAQMELISCLEEPDQCQWMGIKQAFSNPFFLVCWNQSLALLLFPFLIFSARRLNTSSDTKGQSGLGYITSEWRANNLTWTGVFLFSIFLAIIRKGDYLRFVALYGVSVGVSNSIFCSFPGIVYILDVLFLGEAFNFYKMLGVLGCLLGVFCYAIPSFESPEGNKDDDRNVPAGVACILNFVAALLFATYQVLYKLVFKKRRSIDSLLLVNMLSAFIGLSSLIFCYPFIILLDRLPHTSVLWEPLEFPQEPVAIVAFVLIGLLGVFINVGFQIMIKVMPVHVAASFWLLVIPFSLISDWLLNQNIPTVYEIAGALLLLASLYFVQRVEGARQGSDISDYPSPLSVNTLGWK